MRSGKRWRAITSRLLVAVLAVAMVITMMPAAGGSYAYAASGNLETKTPEVVVSGSAVIGGTAYTAENVGLEQSYTRDELKALAGGTDIQYSSVKNQSPFTKLLYRASGVYLSSLLDGTAFDPESDVLKLASNEANPWIVTFDPSKDAPEDTSAGMDLTGFGVQRYFFPGVLAELPDDPEEVQPMLAWASANSSSEDPETAGSEKSYLTLVVGQMDVQDHNNRAYGKYMTYVTAGDPLDEIALTIGSKTYTRAEVLMMDFAEATFTYDTSNGTATDCVRGVPMSVLLAGYSDSDVVTFATADNYGVAASGYTVKELIDNDYILAYEKGGSWDALQGIYESAKKDPSQYGFLTLYGGDEKGKPSKMVNSITVTAASGIDFSKSPYKHITNGGQGGNSPYNIDSITGATLTVEGPGVKTSVPVSVRDLEGRDAGAVRADYSDKREGSTITRTYEGIDLHYILNSMSSGENGIQLTDQAKKVLIKNRNRNTIAEFTVDQIEEAHNSDTPILVAYGTSYTSGDNPRPFVFNNATGADPDLGNEDGCIKLVYNKDSITGDTNTGYTTFGNMAYIYVAEADTPGYKHDKDPYKSPEITNYILTVTGDKIGREVNYTVEQLENMVAYGDDGRPDNSGMGYRDEYSLANSTYWYVNEYEGVQLWKLLLRSGLDAGLANDPEGKAIEVSSTATDGYAATDRFTIEQVSAPDLFGFYEKNPADKNDGTYEGNENIRQGDDVSTGDKLRVGYPVLVAYGVNGYPYVEKSSQAGYLSGLQNDGGPLRVISGKKVYNHPNGSNQAKLLDKIIVGDNTNHYSTHKYHSDAVYTGLADNEISVKILNGADEDAPVLKEKTYTIGDIEEYIYGGKLTRNQLSVAKIKQFYELTKGSTAYSDLYEGINLNFFLESIVELPGYKGTITFSDGTSELALNLEEVLATDNGSNTTTGVSGLAPVLAYGKNGAPMVFDKNTEGYQNKITLGAGTEYENEISVKNDGGPLAVLFPNTDSSVSGKTLTNVTSITINLSADNYAHTKAPFDTYADSVITISGEGTRLGADGKDFALSELEGKQTIAFTGDYSILKDGADAATQERYRGIKLYSLLSSGDVGLKSNADKVIVTTTDGEIKEFSLSDIRKNYVNTVTGEEGLPVLLAYGKGIAGAEDKEDGRPLVAEKTNEGFDAAYGNNGGPVRFVIGQSGAEDVNSGNNLKFVKSIEVTASEMTSWNHNSSEVYKQYRDEKVDLIVKDKDGNDLFNKSFTVGEIEDNTSLVERIVATVTQEFTWEGINFWGWIKQETAGVEGMDDPVSVTVTAADDFSQEIRNKFGMDALNNGIKDGNNYVPIILAYGVGGYPLVIGDKTYPNGEGYDATAMNNGGPLRLITHNSQGTSITYVRKIVIVAGDGSVEPEEPADFTIKGLGSKDITLSVDQISKLKNKAGDVIGQAEGTYTTKGVTKKVKGVLLKNLLANYDMTVDSANITLHTPDGFETTGKGASYNGISFKQATDQKYFLAYQEWDEAAGEWKDIDDIVKNTDIHTNLRMYRNYCEANGLDNQSEWLDECNNITSITVEVPDIIAFKEYPTSGGVRSTWMDKDGTIWVGTYGGGLYCKKAGETEFSVLNTSSTPALKTDFTSAVAADAEGGIWVSQNASYTDPTGNQGVLYIKGGEVTQYLAGSDPATIPNNYVQAIEVGSDGKVWFGSFGGVTVYDPAADSWVTYSKADKEDFPATSVCTITTDDEGGAWLGFYPDGSGTAEDPYAGGFCHITADGTVGNVVKAGGEGDAQFAQSWVRSIAIDQKGTVWAIAAGTNIDDNVGGFIWKWQISKDKLSTYTGKEVFADHLDGSSTTEVRTVAVDAEGTLWFGTSADGILKVSNPQVVDGKMAVDAQYAKETGSWSAANMNNVYSIDFWNGGTAYVGTAGGLLVLGDEPEGSDTPDDPVAEPAGDATADTADLAITGDALVRDGYFTIKGIKNTDGINRVDATFHTVNSAGTAETLSVQGATLENILCDYIGVKDGFEITSIDIYASDSTGVVRTYTAEEAFSKDLDGNKAMFIWTEGGEKVQKVVRGQLTEGEANKGKWVKNANKLVVNGKALSPSEIAVQEIDALPKTVTTDDKAAIEKARADYDALTDEEKAALPAGTEEKLEAAEAKLVAAEVRETAEAVKALAETIVESAAGGYTEAKYTAATYMAYEQAYTAAQAVMADPNAGKADIDAANEALAKAKAALVEKSANTMKVSVKAKTLKAKALKKAKKGVKAITVKKPVGKVTYKRVSGSKYLTINSKTGKITVKKGTRKGNYKIKVKVTAAGGDNHKPLSKTVVVKIKVK